MRNLLDTASIAQSLDGERLTGCLHYPGQRIFLDQPDFKDRDLQHDIVIGPTWCFLVVALAASH
jgi:hypothetical protein